MKRLTTAIALAVVLGVAGTAGPKDRASTIRLMYHSDTQGYYRPCG